MDYINKAIGGEENKNQEGQQGQQGQQGSENKEQGGGGFLGGLGDKFNSAAGGGKESEKNEDYVDKGWLLVFCGMIGSLNTYYRCRLRAGKVHGTGRSNRPDEWK